jgi:hypothetical protein
LKGSKRSPSVSAADCTFLASCSLLCGWREECTVRGLELPFILAVVAANGSILAAKYTPASDHDGLDTTLLAQHVEDPGFGLPINIMIVDQKGDAARVTINTTDSMGFH